MCHEFYESAKMWYSTTSNILLSMKWKLFLLKVETARINKSCLCCSRAVVLSHFGLCISFNSTLNKNLKWLLFMCGLATNMHWIMESEFCLGFNNWLWKKAIKCVNIFNKACSTFLGLVINDFTYSMKGYLYLLCNLPKQLRFWILPEHFFLLSADAHVLS